MTIDNDMNTHPEPKSFRAADQQWEIQGGAWRWAIGAVVVLLLAHPLAGLTMGEGQTAEVAQPTANASALQLSFEHYQAGRYQDAIAAAKAALAADPNSADAYNNLAVSYLGLQMYDEAIQAAQDAIRINPDHQLAKNNLAWIQQEKANAANPPAALTPAGTLLNASLQHFRAGRYKECIEAATQSAKLDPKSAEAFNNIGICAGNLQRWDEAIRNTEKALQLRPDFQLAKNNLAWMQQQKALGAGKKP